MSRLHSLLAIAAIAAMASMASMASVSGVAHAGGLQLASRGVRPTARAGAFVAGADDLNGLWFNPAGLAHAAGGKKKRGFLVDFGYVAQSAEYTRTDSGNVVQPTVSNEAPGLPVPTLGVSWDVGDKMVLGAGLYAPYAALGKYKEDGAQRYSLVDMSESLMVITEVAIAYKVSDKIRVGVGLQNMVFQLASTIVFSGCPGETICAPEDPEFDSLGKIKQLDWFIPSAVLGVQVELSEKVRGGFAFQLPFQIAGKGEFKSRLPSAAFYDNASIVGDRADVSFRLPAIARAGVEFDPVDRWKVEVGMTYEMWSTHDKFTIEPRNVRIEGAPGVGTYEIGNLDIPRNFEDTVAVMIGAEGQPVASMPLRVLAGFSYETAAAPDEFLTVMTVDGNRKMYTAGVGYRTKGGLDIDLMIGVVRVADRSVSEEEASAPQLTPLRDTSSNPLQVFVNRGEYKSSWFMAGAGVKGGF